MPKRRSGTRKRSTKQRGRGIGSALRSAGSYIKRHKLLSRGLGLIPHPTAQLASRMAGMVGLGRRRRTKRVGRRRRRVVAVGVPRFTSSVPMSTATVRSMQKGRGFFGDLGSGIGSALGGLGGGIGSVARGLFGRGRSRASKKVFTTF